MSYSCEKFNELLLDLAYDELDAETALDLMRHKDDCGECQRAYADLMGLRNVAKHIETPPLPAHFGVDILSLAQKKAASFRGEEASTFHTVPPAPVVPTPSIWEKIQSFVFRPAILGAGVALTAVVFGVISLQQKSHTTMLEAPAGVPFEGAQPAIEREAPPSAPLPPSEESQIQSADKSEVQAETAKTVQRIQKAGPGYKPLYEEKSVAKGAIASETDEAAPLPQSDVSKSADVQKNPADLLRSKSTDAATGSGAPARKSASPKKLAEPKVPANAKKKKSSSLETIPFPSQEAPSSADKEAPAEESTADDAAEGNDTSDFNAGLAAYNRGDCSTAVHHFSTYLDHPSQSEGSVPVATHYIARCEKRTGRCGKAVIHYEQLLTKHPRYNKRSEALYEAAACHSKLGHTEKAQTLLEELSLDPQWRAKAQKMLKKL
ncbi:MAG: tetratricopeptide repeat protein [Deltaproteobacteria bacterium]|nr:tetratricopeptide repeat protein [Deltaproteobacteria bacterium]